MRPLDCRQLTAIVNCFLLKYTKILSNFAVNVESKILAMETQLNRVENELKLLDAKVSFF